MNTYGTEIETQFIARVESDGTDESWAHFLWRVTLTRHGLPDADGHAAGPGGKHKRVLEYRMGVGHVQTPCGKRIQRGRYRVTPCDHARCQGKEVPIPPTLYDVFCSLKADDTYGRTFHEWAGDYGMDHDSRKAMDLYIRCQESEHESRTFFGTDWPTLVEDEDYI
jgi:hypothetical protein